MRLRRRRTAVDEAELIARIKAGDKSAASALISVLTTELDEYSRKIGGDLGDFEREVAVENAMTRVVERIDRFDPARATLHTWARSFVRNELNELRRSPREIPTDARELDRPITDPLTDDEPPPSPETTAMAALVLTLSQADQALLRLRVLEKLGFDEIAQYFGPPVRADTMRKRWERVQTKIARLAREDPDLRRYITEEDK
jgi:RNA polymerase sigma factor (sigma-70 family)